MSKVNVDEIQVGDLVEHTFEDDRCLGYVIEIYDGGLRALWSDPLTECNEDFEDENITGHWKVINFEEESKVDELKVYTGKETIEALLEGKTLEYTEEEYTYLYKMNDGILEVSWQSKPFKKCLHSFNHIIDTEFTEVVTPQVGDWVRVTTPYCNYVGKLSKVDGEWLRANWNNNQSVYGIRLVASKDTWQILSPEQVSEHKREQAFAKVGRKLNEFKHGDIVYIDSIATVATVITKNNGSNTEIKLHGINEAAKGYTAKPHQLTPISFVEQQVDLS